MAVTPAARRIDHSFLVTGSCRILELSDPRGTNANVGMHPDRRADLRVTARENGVVNRRFTAVRNPLQPSEFMDELAYAFRHFVALRNHRLENLVGPTDAPKGLFGAVFSSQAILVTAPERAATRAQPSPENFFAKA